MSTATKSATDSLVKLAGAGVGSKIVDPLNEALNLLAKYEGIGAPEDCVKAFRQANIFQKWLDAQPPIVRDAWMQHLENQRAV